MHEGIDNRILYLVRHARSVANEKRVYNSTIEGDEGLSEYGKKQAKRIGAFMKRCVGIGRVKRIYSSPFKRTMQTAEEIVKAIGADEIVEEYGLVELNSGEWEGKTVNEIIKKYPKEWNAWRSDPLHNPIPGGETLLELQSRVIPVIQRIVNENRISVVITHYCVINVILCTFIGQLDKFRAFDTSNGMVAEISMGSIKIPRLRMYTPSYV